MTPAMTAQEALQAIRHVAVENYINFGDAGYLRRAADDLETALSDAERRATEAEADRDEAQRKFAAAAWLADENHRQAHEAQSRLSALEARCGLMREALETYFDAWERCVRGHSPLSSIWHTSHTPVSYEQHEQARSILAYPGGKSDEPTERAQIVAWLRAADASIHTSGYLADAIARGEHLPGGKSDQGEKEKAVNVLDALEIGTKKPDLKGGDDDTRDRPVQPEQDSSTDNATPRSYEAGADRLIGPAVVELSDEAFDEAERILRPEPSMITRNPAANASPAGPPTDSYRIVKSDPPAGGEGKPEPVAFRVQLPDDGSNIRWEHCVNSAVADARARFLGTHYEPLFVAPLSRSGDTASLGEAIGWLEEAKWHLRGAPTSRPAHTLAADINAFIQQHKERK